MGDVLPGVLRDEDDPQRIQPFCGKVLERRNADPPYAAMLVIGPDGLTLGKPFDPL